MNQNQKELLKRLDTIELLLSVIGFIVSCVVYAFSKTNGRYVFYGIAIILGFNIIHSIKKIEKEKEQFKVVKYSKKLISTKKVSY